MIAKISALKVAKLKNFGVVLKKLKSDVDKLDVDKLKTIPIDLKKLSNVVEDDVVKNI